MGGRNSCQSYEVTVEVTEELKRAKLIGEQMRWGCCERCDSKRSSRGEGVECSGI